MNEPKKRGFYGRLALWVMHHRALAVGLMALITALAGFFAVQVRVDSDIMKLMPPDEPVTKAISRIDHEEGGLAYLTLAYDADDHAVRDNFMNELQGRLEALPEVRFAFWKLDDETTFRIGVLQLPVEDLELLRDRIRGAYMLGPALANPFMQARLFDLGPLTDKLAGAGSSFSLDNGGVARMVVRPTGSAHDLPFARAFIADVEQVLTELNPEARGVRTVWKGGPFRHNVEDYESVVRDIGSITAASFVLVLIIIGAAFRAPRAVGIIFIPLIVGNIWTLGLAGATVGSLNTFTSFVNAVLIGLGVEFGVHLYARYRELRTAGQGVEDAAADAWDLVGGACTSACLTASAGFAALIMAHFAGFQQLGWLLSLGLLLTLIAELVLMPVLFTVMEPKAHHFAASKAVNRRKRKLPMWYRLAPMTLLVIGSVTLVAALLGKKIGFEYDLSELRRAGLAYEDLSEQERALARDSFSPMLVSFPDDAARDAGYLKLKARVEAGDFKEVSRVVSIRTVIPEDQAARVAILTEIAALANDPLAAYLPPQVRANLQKLHDFPPETIEPQDLPLPIQQLLGANDGHHRVLMFPKGNMWDMREAAALSDAVARELPGHEVAGEYLALGTLYKLMQRDAPVIGGFAFLLVLIFTALDLRSVRATAGAIAIQVAGIAWWAALLVLSDIKISMVNFVGIPIVMGIGIDVMIHLIHRMDQEGPGRIMKSLQTTGWASALGTSTTVVAFAALSLASSQGIRSLGLLVLLGEMAVTLAGFMLVPLGFATRWHWERRSPAPTED